MTLPGKARESALRQAVITLLAIAAFFGFLVLCNAQHLGANASLHWDASSCVLTDDPMPTRQQLEENRQHIFDLADAARSRDPVVVTAAFLQPTSGPGHVPLETVRRYYSQISFYLARSAFNFGAKRTHSPGGAVVYFQLEAALAMAIALGLLFSFVISQLHGHRSIIMTTVLFLTLASEPVMLSLSRQMLTETAGFLFLVPTIVCFASAIHPNRRSITAIALAIITAGLLFLTIRSRYTLGLAAVILCALVVLNTAPFLIARKRRGHYALVASALIVTFIAITLLDMHLYGPFILPWVYQQCLVESTRLYFHSTSASPLEAFWVMLYVNAPLLALPAIVVVLGLFTQLTGRKARRFGSTGQGPEARATTDVARRLPVAAAGAAMLLLILPMVSMAHQQVSYQPRHLFAFSAAFICLMALVLPMIRWSTITTFIVSLLCAITFAANIYSTTGPQRTTMKVPWPDTITRVLRQRRQAGPHPPLILACLNVYFDWSDNSRVHDHVLVFRTLQQAERDTGKPALLVIDANVWGSGTFGLLVTQFHQPFVWWGAGPDPHVQDRHAIQSAIDAGTAVFLITFVDEPNPAWGYLNYRPTAADLYQARLFRVTGTKEGRGVPER